MAFLEGWRFLSSSRFKMIVQTLAGKLDVTQPLIFLNRTPMVNAFDDEVVGRFTGRVLAADIVADDAEAVVYESAKLELVTTQIPNIKMGQRLGQQILNRLVRMRQGALLPSDNNYMEEWFNRLAANLVMGVRQRLNAMVCAMMLDGWQYNRMGINITGSFGAPANLKVTPVQPWSNDGVNANTNATPLDDILVLANQVAPDNYGIRYNRVTMSSKAFRFIVGTTQFANRAALLAGFATTSAMINQADQPTMQAMLGRLLNMEIELYDAAYNERQEDGSRTRSRVLPANKVLLTDTQNDGDGNVMDVANTVPTEAVVGAATGAEPGPPDLAADSYGPIGYFTGNESFNPPDITGWAVARAMPRRHVPEAVGVLTVGAFT
jgi:hypothetical protein